MHYIRLMGLPKNKGNVDGRDWELPLAIVNDLGENYLNPDEPVDITVTAHAGLSPYDDNISCTSVDVARLKWKPGQFILKPTIRLPENIKDAISSHRLSVSLSIGPTKPELAADSVEKILKSSFKDRGDGEDGLISPVRVGLSGPDTDNDGSHRKLLLSGTGEPVHYFVLGEDIGHSIALHIWDAGLVSLCAIAGTFKYPSLPSSQSTCMQKVHKVLTKPDGVNVLELGSGVGILGLGLGAVYPRGTGDCFILMTDEDGHRRARSNMGILHNQRSGSNVGYAKVEYDHLKWESGSEGRFGTKVKNHRWDLIMLSDCTYNADSIPPLVGTLSAIHSLNKGFDPGDNSFVTRVFLAMKPRHDHEEIVFQMMSEEGWEVADTLTLSLPVLGSESKRVDMYLFEKR